MSWIPNYGAVIYAPYQPQMVWVAVYNIASARTPPGSGKLNMKFMLMHGRSNSVCIVDVSRRTAEQIAPLGTAGLQYGAIKENSGDT